MDLSNLKAPKGATKNRKRIGRGPGSTFGKTAGKGHKGQKARSGGGVRPGFEGGQMPLQMRLPKRGFHNPFSKDVATVNLRDLEARFEDGDVIGLEQLVASGLISARKVGEKLVLKADLVKILGDGDITKKLTVHAHKFSKAAAEKIGAAGGSAEVIES